MMDELVEGRKRGGDVVMVLPKGSEVWRRKRVRDWTREDGMEGVEMESEGVVMKVVSNSVGVVEAVRVKGEPHKPAPCGVRGCVQPRCDPHHHRHA